MLAKVIKPLPILALACLAIVMVACASDESAPAAPSQPAAAAPAPAPAAPAPAAPAAPQQPAAPAPAAPAPAAPVPQAAAAAPAAPAPAPAAPASPAAPAPAAPASAAPAAPAPAAPTPQVAQIQPGATTFEDNQRTAAVRTTQDSVSTFSLDTDRTSFQLALNWARAGYEIEPDSVRSEEWVNAFDYQYEQPRREDSFAVHTDIMPHPLDSEMILARIGFQAPELRDDGRPLNVTLVLDSSGSMREGNRVDIAHAAADSIRRSLRRDDRISVVHFSREVINNLTVENHDPDSRDIRQSIDRLSPGGGTNVQAGLDLGVKIADSMRRRSPNAYNYVILMSDGVANVDATNPFAILESVEDMNASNPIRLITIGVGIENYNDELLEKLAQHGNGWYRYLTDVGQARALFSRDSWLALSIPFADQTRAQVTWNPDAVESWRIVGYENRITADRNFTQARKEFAEIPSGAATTVFYELRPTSQLRLGDFANLGDVELRWVTPISNESNRQHAQIAGQYDWPSNDTYGALLHFGAVVALAADRYSSLPYPDAPYDVQYDLSILQDELRQVEDRLGGLASYQDFAFVLDQIAFYEEPRRPSGYSP